MGASLALAGLSSCRWRRRELLPAARLTSEAAPGQPQQFATTMELAGSAIGLMVTCVDGRPIKIEGNPHDPASLGATHVYAQAALLELYDPDRSKDVYWRHGLEELARSWQDFGQFVRKHFDSLRKTGGEGLRILSQSSTSPTLAALRDRLLEAFPKARWHEYEPVAWHAGVPRIHYGLQEADVVLCFDADLLGMHPMAVRYARDFAQRRDPDRGSMCRLYVVESTPSVTGVMADHRLPLRSGLVQQLVRRLYAAARQTASSPSASAASRAASAGASADSSDGSFSGNSSEASQATSGPLEGGDDATSRFLHAVLGDLRRHAGKCVVAAGPGHQAVAQYVLALNELFGTFGRTFWYDSADGADEPERVRPLDELIGQMHSGEVGTLLILGGNPVYNAPVDFDFREALGRVGTSIHLSLYRDETSRLCTWHLPQSHFLESWGDALGYDGLYRVIQPTIEPLYGGKSAIEVLAMILGEEAGSGGELVKAEFLRRFQPEDGEAYWRRAVHDGLLLVDRPAAQASEPRRQPSLPPIPEDEVPARPQQLEIVFKPDYRLFDGRFANNAWLQELPDPITKLTWGNAALISPATAGELDVSTGDLVILTYQGRQWAVPALVLPGQADGSVAVALGYGRQAAGKVGGCAVWGSPSVGSDSYFLRTSRALYFDDGLELEITLNRESLASTQDHFPIDALGTKTREKWTAELIRQTTLARYLDDKTPYAAEQSAAHEPAGSLWQEPQFSAPRWGMVIDLSKCNGCGACIVACQAENNIPVVGREQVLRRREMHWLRVDRYFQGDPNDPQILVQPVPCMHCELAPCEQVCPVAATVHSREGLNDMVYNRCVGTRYCSNNCPYKVRRFNFFNYHKHLEDPKQEVLKMAHNPQVTVRSRGVMEKCTYCVQRIQAAKIAAKSSGRTTIPDGTVQTACQQVCPTGAIIFGDLADPQSAVSLARRSRRAYVMLAELNIKPRTAYLARVRNPNPLLGDQQST